MPYASGSAVNYGTMTSLTATDSLASPATDRESATSGGLMWSMALLGLWLCFVGLSVVFSGTGFIHPESHTFLPHYLSGRPMIELIYDNNATEWGHYQARELAFVFDWLDCQFIAWS